MAYKIGYREKGRQREAQTDLGEKRGIVTRGKGPKDDPVNGKGLGGMGVYLEGLGMKKREVNEGDESRSLHMDEDVKVGITGES